jgi:hypothetical protein
MSENKIIRESHRGRKEFVKSVQSRTNLASDENGEVIADSDTLGQTEVHTAVIVV